ncbi:MAG: NAD(P)H-hydrate dehydratase [archaeon]
MISVADMKILEDNSEEYGVSKDILMENAGAAVADYLAGNHPGANILFICYHGNNGGDGFVAARHLSKKGASVTVLFAGDKKKLKTAAKTNYSRLSPQMITSDAKLSFADYDVVVDALLGTGASGPLHKPLDQLVLNFNASRAYKVSLDIPTGIEPDTGVRGELYAKPDITLSFHDLKPGLRGLRARVLDIGIPPECAGIIGIGDLRAVIRKRKPDAHKGDSGRVLIVAGSDDYPGAAYLASRACAALRCGTDLVTIAAPEKVAWAINCLCPDLITVKLSGHYISSGHKKQIMQLLTRSNTLLIGPGIGKRTETADVIRYLARHSISKVIDADAIHFVSVKNTQNAIITPHAKELKILCKNSGVAFRSPQALQPHLKNNILLLKGPEDIIIGRNKVKHNRTGNPGMTVGGTGDVLAGMAAGFLSQGSDPFLCASAAAYLNGKIGDSLARKLGNGLIASDFLSEIAKVINNATI